ncbi:MULTISPECIES: cytosine permease [Vibrio]|uniref:cytosine permease n=1 Tax=Vibrio TaxID=662 RepID=UPI000316F749|nr:MULTISPECIES: cytosine permease [Vibrio]ERM57418.1 Cytosine/purine/uracil/thiamine/allantoin permease family protein [Vibrio cyclitrophicus FF75]KAA8599056.1 Cytosine/purine/uracil/thiamine/allantoin permease family protein [Vibrio cyclitrophicus]MBE8556611.1 cytosine permease [Vibrio sp. OPT24]MBU2932409.1 cytosine permease [Vibrio cyclitrophicus]OBS92312.1 permease [Vibrio cyclitrophicus]
MDGTMAAEAYVNKPEATHSHKKIDDFELEPVPEKAKRSWWVISLIWLAIGIDISGLFLGSILSSGIGFEDALLATFIGSGLLAIIAMLCANIGFQAGVSTPLVSSAVFGRNGGKILGFINGISLVGWFAFQADFFAFIMVDALAKYDIIISHLTALIGGSVLMMMTAIYGVRALGKLSTYSVPLMVTLITIGLFMAADYQGGAAPSIEDPLTLGQAISFVMSIWILAAVAAPDIARYAKTRRDAILGAGIGFLVGNSAIILIALILTKMTGTDDLVEVFFTLGLGMAAIIVLVFAQWTTNSSNLTSGGLCMSMVLPKIPRPVLVVIMTIVGIGIAQLGMVNKFTDFLMLLSVTIAPAAGVYIVQYYVLDSTKMSFENIQQVPAWMFKGLASWAFGTAFSACTAPEFFNLFSFTSISALDGILAAGVIYLALMKLSPSSNKE